MARLTIPDQQTYASFTVGAAQSVFPIAFSLFAKADLRVTVAGVELGLSDFTFSGTLLEGGGYAGGTVTFNTAATNETVVIWRDVTPERASQFAPANTVPVGAVDQALNRLAAQMQDVARDVKRAVAVPLGATAPDPDEVLAAALATVNKADKSLGNVTDSAFRSKVFTLSGAPPGVIGRSLEERFEQSVALDPRDFGAYWDNIHDDSDAINAAIAESYVLPGRSTVALPKGTAYVEGTIYRPHGVILEGTSRFSTFLRRTEDYGPTIQEGYPATTGYPAIGGNAANPADYGVRGGGVGDLWMYHDHGAGIGVQTNYAAWTHPTTVGYRNSHILRYVPTNCFVERIRSVHLSHGVYTLGGADDQVREVFHLGIWDPDHAAAQEGISCVTLDGCTNEAPTHPINPHISGLYIAGASVTRNRTFIGSHVATTVPYMIGPRDGGLVIKSAEAPTINTIYVGATGAASIAFKGEFREETGRTTETKPLLDVTGSDLWLDPAQEALISFTNATGVPISNVMLAGKFSGQGCCLNAVTTLPNTFNGGPSVVGLTIVGNINALVGAVFDNKGGVDVVHIGQAHNWNCLDFYTSTDAAQRAYANMGPVSRGFNAVGIFGGTERGGLTGHFCAYGANFATTPLAQEFNDGAAQWRLISAIPYTAVGGYSRARLPFGGASLATIVAESSAGSTDIYTVPTGAAGRTLGGGPGGITVSQPNSLSIPQALGQDPSHNLAYWNAHPPESGYGQAWISNGRKPAEGAGAGTGVPAYYINSVWYRLSDNTAVAV